ncbi:unnamed protein product [Symbiodinium microadriaticum]|nr:unnamed protein product [Symbiodinium microadriaticum]
MCFSCSYPGKRKGYDKKEPEELVKEEAFWTKAQEAKTGVSSRFPVFSSSRSVARFSICPLICLERLASTTALKLKPDASACPGSQAEMTQNQQQTPR